MTGTQRPAAERPARIVFAALVLATFAAFFVVQRLKHTPTVVQRFMLLPYFSPTPSGHNKEERISFRIKQNDKVSVSIVNSSGKQVATLTHDRPLARYTQLSLLWNGRLGPNGAAGSAPGLLVASSNHGAQAPAGEYQVRVTLHDQDRIVLSPKSFKLVLKPRSQDKGAG